MADSEKGQYKPLKSGGCAHFEALRDDRRDSLCTVDPERTRAITMQFNCGEWGDPVFDGKATE